MRTVEIQMGDDGQFKVGLEPETEEAQGMQGAQGAPVPEGEEDFLKPVASLDEALQVARDLLSGDTGNQAAAANENQDLEAGYKRGAGMGPAPGPQ